MKKNKKIKMNTYTIKCMYCAKTFIAYNSSRKFCPDSNCHDCFHNQQKKARYQRAKLLAAISERNYQILHLLYSKKSIRISMTELEKQCFDFDAFFKHHCTEEQMRSGQGDTYEYLVYSLKNVGNQFFEIINSTK